MLKEENNCEILEVIELNPIEFLTLYDGHDLVLLNVIADFERQFRMELYDGEDERLLEVLLDTEEKLRIK